MPRCPKHMQMSVRQLMDFLTNPIHASFCGVHALRENGRIEDEDVIRDPMYVVISPCAPGFCAEGATGGRGSQKTRSASLASRLNGYISPDDRLE